MNDKFDELTKNMAQSFTRRGALKKFGLGLAGIALASLGLANKAVANNGNHGCVEWYCSDYFGGYSFVYVCGGGRPGGKHCQKNGYVSCGACDNCC